MKKIVVFVIFIAVFYQSKAQQLFPLKPADSLKGNLLDKYFKLKPDSGLQLFKSPLNSTPLNGNELLSVVNTNITQSNYDRMPIILLPGYSKMPVIKLEGNDRMPVLKMRDNLNAFGPTTLPSLLPAFKTP